MFIVLDDLLDIPKVYRNQEYLSSEKRHILEKSQDEKLEQITQEEGV